MNLFYWNYAARNRTIKARFQRSSCLRFGLNTRKARIIIKEVNPLKKSVVIVRCFAWVHDSPTLAKKQRQYYALFFSVSGSVEYINECLTCSMIKMGSSVSYNDDTCPQCGANTTKTFIG